MAVNPQSITDAVGAIKTTGSVADAINTLSTDSSSTLAALGAANTLASQAVPNNSPVTSAALGTLGATFS